MSNQAKIMKANMQSTWLFLASMILVTPTHANGLQSFRAFIKDTQGMRADFQQVVADAQGKKVQEVTGTMSLQRQVEGAGKFRWDYNKPYVQQIVGDGTRVWLYDPDLNQVTVRPMGKALGNSPAALLAGSKQIEQSFEVREAPTKEGLDWVVASAKEPDSGFEKIYLGFKSHHLHKMQLYDNFGNITSIQFLKLEVNPKLEAQLFNFKPPTGADIVGE